VLPDGLAAPPSNEEDDHQNNPGGEAPEAVCAPPSFWRCDMPPLIGSLD
jgi:hypothetical protein